MATKSELLLSKESGNGYKFTLLEARISLKWMIEKFSLRPVDGHPGIRSPTFTFLSSKWKLCLCPDGNNSAFKGQVAIFLFEMNPEYETIVNFKTCLQDRNAVNYNVTEHEGVFDVKTHVFGHFLIDRSLLLGKKREELLHNDILTVYCEMSVEQDGDRVVTRVDQSTITERPSVDASTGPEVLLSDLEDLLREQKNCDVSIRVGSETFHAHKCILAARSSVFAAMFQHDMEENRSNVITIVDVEAAVMSDVLQYIYSGKITDDSAHKALDLYVAADKYDLKELKTRCANLLRGALSVDNFFDVAVLADTYNDGMMIDSIKRFVGDNTSFLSGENSKRLVKQCPDLASEVLIVLSKKLSEKPK